jgi:alpha/beta superfamily hydrolase
MRSAPAQRLDLAVRTDAATSTTEMVGFLGAEPGMDRLFGSFALPSGQPRACVLISSSLYAENGRNYRREVILARELAVRGIASLRYHYRGTGYSDGDPAAISFPSMCADAADALTQLSERCPGVPVGYVGTRLGALVTASAARDSSRAPVLLWDPVPSAAAFFQDAAKARRAGGMVSDRQQADGAGGEEDPWATGFLDSLGYRMPVGLRDSLDGVSLVECLGDAPGPILVVTMVPAYEPKPIAMAAAEEIRAATGSEVEVRRIEGRLSWWTSRDSWDPDEDHPPTQELISRSAAWLERHLTEARAS